MPQYKPNISFITKHTLCTGCGVCQDSCPKDAISFQIKDGLNIPVVDENICFNGKGCSRCYDVCPGKGIELRSQAKELFDKPFSRYDYYIGHYVNCYTGYSNDGSIRLHSASGGLVSQFLVFLLEQGYIAGAVVTGFDPENVMKPYTYIARTRDDILNAKSSKYCPVSLNGMAQEIREAEGQYVIVGLPCHIQGFHNLRKKDAKFNSHLFGLFAIYCSSSRNFYSQEYLKIKYNFRENELSSFAYRDDGCLGNLKAEKKNGEVLKVDYTKYYPMLRSFFKPKRCLTCIDHYGDLADVCFGDIHLGKYKNDKVGISSLVVRNQKFENLFQEAVQKEFLSLSDVSSQELNESQRIMLDFKRKISKAFISVDKLFLQKTPKYDIKPDGRLSFKSLVKVIYIHLQRYIGAHRSLWFLINIINRKS